MTTAGRWAACGLALVAAALAGPACVHCDLCPVAVVELSVAGAGDAAYGGVVIVADERFEVSCPGSQRPFARGGWTCGESILAVYGDAPGAAGVASVELAAATGGAAFAGDVVLMARRDTAACDCETFVGALELAAP